MINQSWCKAEVAPNLNISISAQAFLHLHDYVFVPSSIVTIGLIFLLYYTCSTREHTPLSFSLTRRTVVLFSRSNLSFLCSLSFSGLAWACGGRFDVLDVCVCVCVCAKPAHHAANRWQFWLTNRCLICVCEKACEHTRHFYQSAWQVNTRVHMHMHKHSLTWQLAPNIINSCHSVPLSKPTASRDSKQETEREGGLMCAKAWWCRVNDVGPGN